MKTKIFIFIALMAILISSPQAALIAEYLFNGNANDSSGNNYDGAVYGATLTTDRFGNANSAYLFDGNDSVAATFALPSIGTFSVWATHGPSYYAQMLLNTGPNGSGPDLFLYNDLFLWNVWDSGGNPFAAVPSDALNEEFHHYAVVVTATTTTLYYDGSILGTARHEIPNGTTFTIGAEAPGGSSYGWEGVIDDVRVYNTALTSTDITALYTENNYIPEPATLIFAVTAFIGGFLCIKL